MRTLFFIPLFLLAMASCTESAKDDEEEASPEESGIASGAQPDVERTNGSTTLNPDRALVDEAISQTTWSDIAGDNADPDHVRTNLSLTSKAANGVDIAWTSNNPSVSSAGIVDRPPFGEAKRNGSVVASFSRGSATGLKEFPLTVLQMDPTDEQAVQAALDAITAESIKGSNGSLDLVTGNLILPTAGVWDTKVSWTSTNPSISAAGVVNRPETHEPDGTGSLTATVTSGNASGTKSFATTVPRKQILLISEAAPGDFSYDGWFEITNVSAAAVSLADFGWRACNLGCSAAVSGSLPNVSLAPGDYVLIHPENSMENESSDDDIYVADLAPRDSAGIFEITKAGSTVDFVRWHDGNGAPALEPVAGSFGGSVVVANVPRGSSMGRPFKETGYVDQDAAADWVFFQNATPGTKNGTGTAPGTDSEGDGLTDAEEGGLGTDPFSVDTDGDWFSDGQEVRGYGDLDLEALGASPLVRDIFVEIDYMKAPAGLADSLTDSTVDPYALAVRRAALDKVRETFANYTPDGDDGTAYPLRLHLDVGDLFDQEEGIDPADYDLGGGEEIPFSRCLYLGTDLTRDESNCRDLYDLKQQHFAKERRFVFHYFIFAWSQMPDGSAASSGLAEIVGNDGIVSIGSWDFLSGADMAVANYQAATFLHELGHNLGLEHGGDEGMNYKPSYVSSMNYLYQLAGLDDDDSGDIFYREIDGHPRAPASPDNSPHTGDFLIGYSTGKRATLDETSLDETAGWSAVPGASIDFDADDGISGTPVSANIQPADYNVDSTDTLRDHDDWAALDLEFQLGLAADWNGASFDLIGAPDPDRQRLAPQCQQPPPHLLH